MPYCMPNLSNDDQFNLGSWDRHCQDSSAMAAVVADICLPE